jgi:hypothetical protein
VGKKWAPGEKENRDLGHGGRTPRGKEGGLLSEQPQGVVLGSVCSRSALEAAATLPGARVPAPWARLSIERRDAEPASVAHICYIGNFNHSVLRNPGH